MLKRIETLIKYVIITVLPVLLIACANPNAAGGKTKSIVGTYELTSFISEQENDPNAVSDEDLQKMKDLGYTCSLEVNEDGTAVMDVFGDKSEFKWDDAHFTLVDGSPADYIATDKTITIMQSGSNYRMVFTRVEASSDEQPAEAPADTDSSAEEAPAEETTENN